MERPAEREIWASACSPGCVGSFPTGVCVCIWDFPECSLTTDPLIRTARCKSN